MMGVAVVFVRLFLVIHVVVVVVVVVATINTVLVGLVAVSKATGRLLLHIKGTIVILFSLSVSLVPSFSLECVVVWYDIVESTSLRRDSVDPLVLSLAAATTPQCSHFFLFLWFAFVSKSRGVRARVE
jgi:hypothetical protein